MLSQLRKLNSLKNYNFNSSYGVKNLHITVRRFVEERTEAMESKHMGRINSILNKYDLEQKEKMLKIINNYSLNELLSYEISKARANKLLAWRTRYGVLNSLNEIFSIESFGCKITEKFLHSLLLEPKTIEVKLGKGQTRTAPFVTPSLEAEQRVAIKSAVSVRIGVNSVTWSRLDIPGPGLNEPCLLTHWQHHEISEKKLHINELIHRCLYVNHLIPEADCYIFENPQMAQANNNPGSVEQQNINIQKSQVTAMLGYALTSRKHHQSSDGMLNETTQINNTINLPNVFYARKFLSARLFNHLVGTERVSSEDTILNMMRTVYNTEKMPDHAPQQISGADNSENFSGCVQFPAELREMFSKAPRYYREFLGQTLLLNLTFLRLVLKQDAKSIAIVSRSGNNDAATSK